MASPATILDQVETSRSRAWDSLPSRVRSWTWTAGESAQWHNFRQLEAKRERWIGPDRDTLDGEAWMRRGEGLVIQYDGIAGIASEVSLGQVASETAQDVASDLRDLGSSMQTTIIVVAVAAGIVGVAYLVATAASMIPTQRRTA